MQPIHAKVTIKMLLFPDQMADPVNENEDTVPHDEIPEVEVRQQEVEVQAPELPAKTDALLPGPVVVAYTDDADDTQNLIENPELVEKIQKIDDHFRWNVWVCFFSCGLMGLLSNYFVACWLMSLLGIYRSYRCDSAKKRRDLAQATLLSSEARLSFYISVLVGAAVGVGLTLRFLAGQNFSSDGIFLHDGHNEE